MKGKTSSYAKLENKWLEIKKNRLFHKYDQPFSNFLNVGLEKLIKFLGNNDGHNRNLDP
jgi:hypothetical protein